MGRRPNGDRAPDLHPDRYRVALDDVECEWHRDRSRRPGERSERNDPGHADARAVSHRVADGGDEPRRDRGRVLPHGGDAERVVCLHVATDVDAGSRMTTNPNKPAHRSSWLIA